ncbi:riboflavin aldehyde-forming enzyme [Plectosphaerella plurivora]|uniref:Riboflavin aldehyde-forming enzyme n=1 Tax=Plectosphaerella plurivora TaxID=936078 RepID=A0A9P8VMJ9_9PEZI|nr:riboflavin aldehyde-forming enzyme [Plectosphaerella plurivora]
MRSSTIIGSLLAGAVGAQAASVVPSDINNAIAAVNQQRAAHEVTPLAWNDNLANDAATWAAHLKAIDQAIHATEAQRPNQGEVLAYFTSSAGNMATPFTAAVNKWLAGGANYPAGGVVADGTESWNHWSQLMWSTSTEIGCGAAQATKGAETKVFVVCRLAPEGNIVGQSPFPNNALLARQNLAPGPFTGDLTHFTTGLGACGNDDTGLPGILALSHLKMGAPSNNNPLCNRRVKLEANGRVAYATVRDKCMGCAVNDVDVSEDVFKALYDDLGLGRRPVTWTLV